MAAPAPLFILCPGRSFSSVVAAMIGQHPACYGLPELNLFLGRTVAEALRTEMRGGGIPMQGLKRVLAQLHAGAQTDAAVEAATDWIEAHGHWSAAEVMGHIQERVGARILVEKSPANVVVPETLAHLVTSFPHARYLQLLRHPRSRGQSQMRAVEELRSRPGLRRAPPVPDYEFKWTGTHRMIRALESELRPGQLMWIRGEDLLRAPRLYLPQIAEWLGIDAGSEAVAAMMRPEESPYSRPGPAAARYGANTGFLRSPALDEGRMARIEAASLKGPLDWDPAHGFAPDTVQLAQAFGYV